MTPLQMERALRRAGVEIDASAMREAADGVFAKVALALEGGQESLDQATWRMLDRKVELATNDVLRRQVKGAVRDARLHELEARLGAKTKRGRRDPKLIWIATMVGTCESCEDRHGEEKTLRTWRRWGLPGSHALLCNGNCNCQLLLAEDEVPVDVEFDLLG